MSSSAVPYLRMCSLAERAFKEARVAPFHCSNGRSDAMEITSTACSVEAPDIFSTPAQMTTLNSPLIIPRMPCLREDPPEDDTVSTRTLGIRFIPYPIAQPGEGLAGCSKDSGKACPR